MGNETSTHDFFVDPKDKKNEIHITSGGENLWIAGDGLATLESKDCHYGNPELWVCKNCTPEFLKEVFTTWEKHYHVEEAPPFDLKRIKELTGGDTVFDRGSTN